MEILELYDIDQDIKINDMKEVTSGQIYKSQNLNAFNPQGLFSEEIFGQTTEDRKYTCAYIKLPLHVFNPHVAKNIITRSGGIIRKLAYGEVRCNLTSEGVLVADAAGKYCGLKDLYNIWEKIDVKKNINSRSDYVLDILTKCPKRLLFNDKIYVLPPELRKVGTRNGKQVKSELNSMYIHIINMKSVLAHTTATDVYQLYNKFQDAVINLWTFINNYTGGKNGFFQRQLLAKNTTFPARNVISAPRYDDDCEIGIFKTGYPLHTCCTLFNPLIKFEMRQFFSFSNIQDIHPRKYEVVEQNLKNIYDEKMIDDLLRIYMYNPGSRFRRIYLDPENKIPLQMEYLDLKTNQMVTRDFTLTDLCYLCCKTAIVDADRTVYTVRYPIGDYLGAFFTKVHILSTVKTTKIQFRGENFNYYPIINFDLDHNQVSRFFADTLTPSNSRLKAIGGDYDGDTVKSVGIWSDEANEQATKLMYSKIYNIKPEATTPFIIEIECLGGLFGLSKGALEDDKAS